MSQGQPRMSQQEDWDRDRDQDRRQRQPEPIRYGDVLNVTGDLAKQPIAPGDASLMQSAETNVFGQTQKGGAAATMQAAAAYNARAGLVGPDQVSEAAANRGVSVTETDVPGARIVTERVAGEVVGQYIEPTPVQVGVSQTGITIGQALEAVAQTASGQKPIDQSDAAAIQAAEARATGSSLVVPGGLAATAQSAASYNASLSREQDKIKLADVLAGATAKLPADKVVSRTDADGVVSAELRNNPNLGTQSGGVSASMTAAATVNENVNT